MIEKWGWDEYGSGSMGYGMEEMTAYESNRGIRVSHVEHLA